LLVYEFASLILRGFTLRCLPLLKTLSVRSLLLLLLFIPAVAQVASDEALKGLPDRIGSFRAQGTAQPLGHNTFKPEDYDVVSSARRSYVAPGGETFGVTLIRTVSNSGAYALLRSSAGGTAPTQGTKIRGTGAVGVITAEGARFYKGRSLVILDNANGRADESALSAFAKSFAEMLDGAAGEIPILVEHLPRWETVEESAGYAVSLPALQEAAGNRPVLEAVSFDGGAEAVTARYDGARLVIVEFTTPQYAADNDAHIAQRIEQLRGAGQPIPSAYRRVGNYAVFVFDAPDEQVAKQLVDGVHYEKEVRWLGDNPRALARAERAYGLMTLSVLINTVKATGIGLLLSLGIGGLLGGIVFLRRRARALATEGYSDAGGMVRLNIDDLSVQHNPAKLLGKGDG
jgi:hypothetical protein